MDRAGPGRLIVPRDGRHHAIGALRAAKLAGSDVDPELDAARQTSSGDARGGSVGDDVVQAVAGDVVKEVGSRAGNSVGSHDHQRPGLEHVRARNAVGIAEPDAVAEDLAGDVGRCVAAETAASVTRPHLGKASLGPGARRHKVGDPVPVEVGVRRVGGERGHGDGLAAERGEWIKRRPGLVDGALDAGHLAGKRDSRTPEVAVSPRARWCRSTIRVAVAVDIDDGVMAGIGNVLSGGVSAQVGSSIFFQRSAG